MNFVLPHISRNRALLVASFLGAYGVLGASLAGAMPLERFETPLRITCEEGQRFCSAVVREQDALGRNTGIAVTKSPAGEVSVEVSRSTKGRLEVVADGVTDLTLTLSWDGDSNPEQLSGSGLNCFDVTQHTASAFIISQARMQAECGEVVSSTECPSLSVEARVYNPADPTGQKFLTSLGRRTVREATDIVIPFSNFLGQGPRGKASFDCVGAVTLAFTFRGFAEMDFSVGPIYSNGIEGLTPLPTPTQIPTETATVTPTSTAVESVASAWTETPGPREASTPLVTASPVVALASETSPNTIPLPSQGSESREPLEAPGVSGAAEPSSKALPSESPVPAQRTPQMDEAFEEDEAVYGELVIE
jgi:hypothetical protein